MDWDTLIWSTVLLAIVSCVAWFLGRCEWYRVTKIMDYDLVGSVARLFGGRAGEIGQRERGADHDPDLAFRRSIRLPQSIVAVLVLVLAFYWLLGLLITWKAHSYYESNLRITPVVFAEMGLPHDGNNRAQTGQHVIQWLDDRQQNNQAASLFLFQLSGQKDATVFDSEVKEHVKAFVKSENDDKTAPIALQRLLVKMGGQKANDHNSAEDDVVEVRKFLKTTILTDGLNPASFDQMVTKLNLQGSLEEDSAADRTNTSGTPATGVAYLAAIKHGLAKKFEDHPGLRVVTAAIYERIREDVLRFRRVRVLFVGEIQEATIAVYLLALVLLGSRARVLATQRDLLENRFAEFMVDKDKSSDTKVALAARPNNKDGRPGEAILPDASPRDKASTEREIKILQAYKAFLDREPYCKSNSFVLGTLLQIYRGWDSLWATGGNATSASQTGREMLSSLVARNEAQLERVEYSLIDYLVWVMPSLGFIGTVVGISQALGDADEVVRASDQASQAEAITLVTSVLGVAFDTTLIALVCTIPVMLLISWFRSGESHFLLDVDQRISASLFR